MALKNIGVSSNINKTKSQLDKLFKNISMATGNAVVDVYELTVAEVLNNENWSSQAIYKGGPQAGEKYDLNHSGQLLGVIENRQYNWVTLSGTKVTNVYKVGIGNIPVLDSLKSDPSKQGSNPDTRYWRLVVYGRASIPGWKFVSRGEKWGVNGNKIKGVSKPSENISIAGTPATYMFENGLSVASKSFPSIVSRHIKGVL